jgi:hypothetical protein
MLFSCQKTIRGRKTAGWFLREVPGISQKLKQTYNLFTRKTNQFFSKQLSKSLEG